MTEKHYISVILPLKIEWEPCYYTTETVHPGERVKLSFANKEYIGVVSRTDITPDIQPERIKEIISIERDLPVILPEEIDFWRQIADYYLCTIGEVYKAAYPIVKTNLEQARAEAKRKVCQRRAKTVELLQSRLKRLQERLQAKTAAASRAKEGTKAKARALEEIRKISEEIHLGNEALDAAVKSLEDASSGIVHENLDCEVIPIQLSNAQKEAEINISKGFQAGKPVLLNGVTGSGKTEIYIKFAQDTINSGRNVLYLVPEIALSRQLEERLQKYFGHLLITFHSGQSAQSRRNSAELIRNSNYIALCTRSGLFLPHHDLGLIIVDEEHDASYKQDSPAPRYNGRDAALIMSRIHKGCNIILGSATPSLEERYNSLTGKHCQVTLKERYHGSGQSDIEIIDTKAERRKNGMAGNFSRKLIDHIKKVLTENGQVLILRSRKSWATALQCEECGEIQKCPHCNVSISLNKAASQVICHYCGYRSPYLGICNKCSGRLTTLGSGTQKIEEEAATLFPEARIARLDGDASHDQAKIIKAFANGEIDILVGTQMIGKGFDFNRLNLVAVIAADAMLGVQDFRADEKALQLLEQFRGRCGRREKRGLFIIQTAQPEHPIYRNLIDGAEEEYSQALLEERKDFGFPPYTRILEISIRDRHENRAERMAKWLAEKLFRFGVTGPYAPAVDKIADLYIRKIRLCLAKDRFLADKKMQIKKIAADFEKDKGYDGHITIDVDPS